MIKRKMKENDKKESAREIKKEKRKSENKVKE